MQQAKQDYIDRAMLETLQEQVWTVVIGSLVVAFIIAYFYVGQIGTTVFIALLAFIAALLIGRLAAATIAKSHVHRSSNPRVWLNIYGLYMMLKGSAWGMIGWYLSYYMSAEELLIYLFCMAGLAAGATATAAAHPLGYMLYNVPVALGIIYIYKSNRYGTIWVPTLLMTVFIGVTLATCVRLHKMIRKSIVFGYENAELAGRLERKSKSLHEANYKLAGLLESQYSKMHSLLDERKASSKKEQQLKHIAFTDALTGVPNRRAFDLKLEEQWNIAKRNKLPFSLIMIDIDHFKSYNDHAGHQAGDDCLSQIADILKQHLRRASDTLCRYGGEEFAVILSYESGLEGEKIAEELRLAIESAKIEHPDPQFDTVTISLGVGSIEPRSSAKTRELINLADAALYRAKSAGRNRAVLNQKHG